ncbi:MAG: UvrD-helicase domain-containing protein [Thermoplasmatota archaeon]
MNEPNDEQEELIEQTDGIYIADAGPGTGKTFTISLRYAHILENTSADPDDILLITFTNNAADNMKERIINLCDYDKSALRDAPISTFHGLCNNILRKYGFEAPEVLGIDDRITSSTNVIENEVIEKQEFIRFINSFIDEHPEYEDYYKILYDYSDLLGLIKSLGAKGIIPKKNGWFRNSDKHLDGDYEKFKELFDEANEPRTSGGRNRQSELRDRLGGYKYKCFTQDAPAEDEVRGDGKQIPEEYAEICFHEDREELKQFVHDVYFEYMKYALSRNYLNFSMMIMFAFALVCEDHELRDQISYDHIMIDEFQDTNEIQFKLALLLSKTGNICVVGDWKQSIFSFQYASVDNIIDFKNRLKEYKEELNRDYERVSYPVDIKDDIHLVENFRSTQEIIDFSEQGLMVEATKNEDLDKQEIKERITKLEEVNNPGPTEINAYTADDEIDLILWKITNIVDNERYKIGNDVPRKLNYEDIAVLTRTRNFGLQLMKKAEDKDIPVAYEGGVELFSTESALLLLAWLRILKDRTSKRGWAVVLERAGYTFDEVEYMLKNCNYPDDMFKFRNRLSYTKTIGQLAKTIFGKYGLNDPFTDKIIDVLENVYENTNMNTADIINFIEANIESGETYEVDSTTEKDVFKIQTIHSSKGLEYPVIILADMGKGGGGFGSTIDFNEPIGLRQNKLYSTQDYPYIYDNWKKYVISKCLSGDYDEARRLFYVAMTRAENYLYLTAEKDKESEFFNNMDIEPQYIEPDIKYKKQKVQEKRELKVPSVRTHAPVKYSAHYIVDVSLEDKTGLGTEYGTKVHNFAEMYIDDGKIQPRNIDEENIKKYIDDLQGELLTEEVCLLPVDIDQRKFLFNGVIDLINIDGDTVKIVDYKTDRDLSSKKEYFKQISIYYHAVKGAYPKRNVNAFLFYTEDGTEVPVDPLTLDEIIDLVMKDR